MASIILKLQFFSTHQPLIVGTRNKIDIRDRKFSPHIEYKNISYYVKISYDLITLL